jgi:hypothetical protein
LIILGYMPLYSFSYANAQTHQVINGNATTSAWTPEWPGNPRKIITLNFPGLDPTLHPPARPRQLDFLRAVSRGSQELTPELVGQYRDHADAFYYQDRSGNYSCDRPDRGGSRSVRTPLERLTAIPSPLPEIIDRNLRDVRRLAGGNMKSTMAASFPATTAKGSVRQPYLRADLRESVLP